MTGTFTAVVSAGTYHLPFDRLIDWVRGWAESHPDVAFIVQHGTTKKLAGARNLEMIAPGELLSLYGSADVLVLQGGAGGIMDARQAGRIPIVVPRVPGSGEVVDHHQVQFSRQVAELGLAHVAETERDLHELLTAALDGVLPTRSPHGEPTPGVENTMVVLGTTARHLPRAEQLRRAGRSMVGILRRG